MRFNLRHDGRQRVSGVPLHRAGSWPVGWDTRNPSRGGAVYTQGEFRRHDSLLTEALGKKAPENTVVIPWDGGPRYWIVEAKRTHQERAKALREAQGYADRINAEEPGAARFATGIAGTPDQSFYVTTTYWDGHTWREVAINNYETTGFLTPEQCRDILDSNDAQLALFDDDPDRFLKKANAINRTLHDNEVPVADRASVMAALLLALAQDGISAFTPNPVHSCERSTASSRIC